VVLAISVDVVQALRAKFEAVLPHLDERQQRLVMAQDSGMPDEGQSSCGSWNVTDGHRVDSWDPPSQHPDPADQIPHLRLPQVQAAAAAVSSWASCTR